MNELEKAVDNALIKRRELDEAMEGLSLFNVYLVRVCEIADDLREQMTQMHPAVIEARRIIRQREEESRHAKSG